MSAPTQGGAHYFRWGDYGDEAIACDKAKATHAYMPAAQYAALVAERDALREALAQVVPDWLPVSSAEAKWAVRECAEEIMVRLFRARTALGAERG